MAGLPLLPTRDTPSQLRRISTRENTDFKSFTSIRRHHGASSKSVTRKVKKKRKVYWL